MRHVLGWHTLVALCALVGMSAGLAPCGARLISRRVAPVHALACAPGAQRALFEGARAERRALVFCMSDATGARVGVQPDAAAAGTDAADAQGDSVGTRPSRPYTDGINGRSAGVRDRPPRPAGPGGPRDSRFAGAGASRDGLRRGGPRPSAGRGGGDAVVELRNPRVFVHKSEVDGSGGDGGWAGGCL